MWPGQRTSNVRRQHRLRELRHRKGHAGRRRRRLLVDLLGHRPRGVAGTRNISEDPEFVDPGVEERNFHLQPASPARNAADPEATVARDIDGDTRPAGERSDMGADEIPE